MTEKVGRRQAEKLIKAQKDLTAGFIDVSELAAGRSMEFLDYLYQYVQEKASSQVIWYNSRKKWPKRISLSLRVASVICVAFTGVYPALMLIFKEFFADRQIWGYFSLALAAALLLLDKYTSRSFMWMLYMSAAQDTRARLVQFQTDWPRQVSKMKGGADVSPEHFSEAMDLIANFSSDIHSIEKEETRKWFADYQLKEALLEAETVSGKKQESGKQVACTERKRDAADQSIRVASGSQEKSDEAHE